MRIAFAECTGRVAQRCVAARQRLEALFVLNVQSGRVTVGGSGTSAAAILEMAGLQNAAASVSGFKPVGDEALLGMRPEVIVVMKRSAGGHDAEQAIGLPALAGSPAVRDGRIVVMDGLLMLSFGPRVAEAARKLMQDAYSLGRREPVQ